ncbi:hypothetical protein ACFYPN_09705 [Streptomyces sp. NPDC005576]|uniref:hypothetical protein n=1 Tax=Streptomyces sp. NPDC005576 TaxID=3364726 RepID=UPI0036792CA5
MNWPPPAGGRVAPAPGEHSIETHVPLIIRSVVLDEMVEQLALDLADFACHETGGQVVATFSPRRACQ